MATLTADELAYAKTKLGTDMDAVDLQARYDRLGSLPLAIGEVLDQRVADMLASPLSFTVPGEYSENREGNIRQLIALADQARVDDPSTGLSTVRVSNPAINVGR